MCNIINKTWNGYYISYHTPNFCHVKPNINLNDNGMKQHIHSSVDYSYFWCLWHWSVWFSLFRAPFHVTSWQIHWQNCITYQIQWNICSIVRGIFLVVVVISVVFLWTSVNATIPSAMHFNSAHEYLIKCESISSIFLEKPYCRWCHIGPTTFSRAYNFFLLHVLFT